MTVYHIVLFKLKPGISPDRVAELKKTAQAMVGQVPGLQRLDFGPPLASTASRAQGFDIGLVAILDKPEDLPGYADHPAHQKVLAFRTELTDSALAYDLEF